MKECFKCNKIKPLSDFYKHKGMADGRLNKCKCCAKKDTIKNRAKNVSYYREYDRERGARQDYSYHIEYRSKNPMKYSAHRAVANAIRLGVLIPQLCEECAAGESVHAHHDDYLKQLDVRWLCPACHKAWHIKNGEGLNG